MPLVKNVCRLCLSKDNLVWVFDKRLNSENNMKDIILITTGVEIHDNDVISQMICEKCCHISIRMFQFRKASQKHDRYLKKQYEEMIKTSSVEHDIPNSGRRVETEKKVEPMMETKEVNKPNQKYHKSVRDLLKIYPRLKLPSICLKYNIEPCIIIETEMVENFLNKETYSEQKCVRLPELENGKSAESTAIDPSHISASVMNAEENSEIGHYNKENIQKQSIVSVSESVYESLNEGDTLSDHESDGNNKITIKRKKRRLTGSDLFLDTETKNFSSSEPLPKKKLTCESAEHLYQDESVPMFLCSICNSVHNNVRELKRHQFRHLRCQYCGSKFKTIGLKKTHIQSLCAIKKIMNHLPSVKLEKIELDLRMRTKYPEAFIGYPLVSGLRLNASSTEETSGSKPPGEGKSKDNTPGDKISGNQTSEKDERVLGWNAGCTDNNRDIIEILSDDDLSLPSREETCNNPPIHEKELIPVSNITRRILNREISATYSTVTGKLLNVCSPNLTNNPAISTTPPVISATPSVIFTTPPIISTQPVISNTPSVISNTPVMSTTPPVILTTPSLTSSTCPVSLKVPADSLGSALVTPDIKIRNSAILDPIDIKLTDIRILKELLIQNTSFRTREIAHSQTELPCNRSISAIKSGQPIEFKNLKILMYSYKIPVLIEKGTFQIRYVYKSNNFKPKRAKKNKLYLWNKLTPIDVKVTNNNNQLADRDKMPVNTSEVTTLNSSTGSTSNCTAASINAFNPSYSTIPNQQMYNRNGFSTPVNSFTGSSDVNVYTQVVPSNFGIVNEAPGSEDSRYVLVGENTAEQQSKTNTANSFAPSNVQRYPQSVNMNSSVLSKFGVGNKVSVAQDPRYILPGANIVGVQTTPMSYLNDIRSPPNVNPFAVPNMAVPNTTPVVSQNSLNSAPNISNSHSLLCNPQNSLVVQNKGTDPVSHHWPSTAASVSNGAGQVFGSIRVKSVWELT